MVTDTYLLVLKPDGDSVSGAHDEFINAVVYDFLHQDVDSVIYMGTVSKASDVHTRSEPDMLQRGHGFYRAFIVNGFHFCHNG